MKDPYSVLGVNPRDSMDTIKRTYREMARKYHPDNYVGNDLADLAEEKMKEINEAYDQIVKERENGGGQRTQGEPFRSSGGGIFGQIRSMIGAGRLDEAEQLLHEQTGRNAEWHFLMGSIHYRRGWMDEAAREYQIACQMDPGNREYRTALNFMSRQSSPYRQRGGVAGMNGCDCCTSLICADCCCECMGGDLISCC